MKVRGSETTVPKINLIWDSSQVQKQPPIKLKPYFPMKPDKAVQRLTGRETLNKALASYKFFFNVRKAKIGQRPWSSDRIYDNVMNGDWTAERFIAEAQDYLSFPRKGFNLAEQKKRISKLFSEFRLRLPDFDSDNK